ncbi:hypothetical protein SAMN05443245_1200 [Paraburkholderia fungorum]|uniref:Uncharacterized protein n=1 Tax=Paraburkholderia fungorum TaxID=134537 RepID=A0A1H1AJ86_9BURK|nr:hypothetical protein SAMN05443245_1200 [Paraburkholderia fungorum]
MAANGADLRGLATRHGRAFPARIPTRILASWRNAGSTALCILAKTVGGGTFRLN